MCLGIILVVLVMLMPCIASKLIKKNQDVIIITDTYSKYIDINDKSIRPIFSDGASCTSNIKKKMLGK